MDVIFRSDTTVRTRHNWNAQFFCRGFCLNLITHHADVLRGRADEGDAVSLKNFRKACILREETVTGMYRVGASDFTGCQNLRNVEVAVAGYRRTNTNTFVSKAHVHCVFVGSGVDRNSANAQLFTCPKDAECDLAAVCDEDLGEHRDYACYSMMMSGSPNSTG